mgnify:CR=1 FL=1
MTLRPFHLAFPVHNLDAARAFWGGAMGCPEGRSSPEWIDFDFFGHQIVAHLVPGSKTPDAGGYAAQITLSATFTPTATATRTATLTVASLLPEAS